MSAAVGVAGDGVGGSGGVTVYLLWTDTLAYVEGGAGIGTVLDAGGSSVAFLPEKGAKSALAIEATPNVRFLSAEQSNSSLIVDEKLMLKLFRRVRGGPHPEAEMSRHLTRIGFTRIPALLGEVVRRDGEGQGHSLAIVQAFVRNQGDVTILPQGSGVLPALAVCKLPDGIDFDTGAAMMLKGLTVQYLLRRTLPAEGLQPGDFVLWHAAAGGVGLIACQWARALGYRLIATAGSEKKCALALANGAQAAINYRADDFVERVQEITGGAGVKVVYDSVGKDTWEGSLQCLRPFGLMASFGNASGAVPPFAPGVLAAKCLYVTRATLFTHIATRERCQAMADDLFAVVESGQVKIHIDQRFALADVQAAHRALEARQTTGSTILTV